MDGWWPAWWAGAGALVFGLVILALVGVVVARRVGRTGRELARLRVDVRASMARLRSGRRREQGDGVGRIPSVPMKGE